MVLPSASDPSPFLMLHKCCPVDCWLSSLVSRGGFRAFIEEPDGADVAAGHAQRAGTTAPSGNRQDNHGGPRQWDSRGGDRGGYNSYGGNAAGYGEQMSFL